MSSGIEIAIKELMLKVFRAVLISSMLFFGAQIALAGELHFTLTPEKDGLQKADACSELTDAGLEEPRSLDACENDPELATKIKKYWKFDETTNKVTGCMLVTEAQRPKAVIRDIDIAICKKELQTTVQWVTDEKTKIINSCFLKTTYGGWTLEGTSIAECLQISKVKTGLALIFDKKLGKAIGCQRTINNSLLEGEKISPELCSRSEDKIDKVYFSTQSKIDTSAAHVLNTAWQGAAQTACVYYANTEPDLFILGSAKKSLCQDEHIILAEGKKSIQFFDNGKLISYIPEIMSLSEKSSIPPTVYKKYSTTTIAKTLIQRIRKTRELQVSDSPYNYMANSKIEMAFLDTYLESIKQSCFQNQHQVKHSQGANDPSRRKNLEQEMIGLNLDDSDSILAINEILPKYAYLDIPVLPEESSRVIRYAGYGNIYAVFNDKIKERVTWTIGDSLDISANPSEVRSLSTRGGRFPMSPNSSAHYFEAQIWGPVCISDVEYFLVNCPRHSTVSTEVLDSLAATGKPIYQCEAVNTDDQFFKGVQLR